MSLLLSLPAAAQPEAVSVVPTGGSGVHEVFRFTYSDATGGASLHVTRSMINFSLNHANGCEIIQYVGSDIVFLQSDDGLSWIGPGKLGEPGTLENNQCIFDTGSSSAEVSGTELRLDLSLTFKPMFTGSKNIYMLAVATAGFVNSGWQLLGTWTPAPIIPEPPDAQSVNPPSGFGSSTALDLTHSDPNGFSYIYVTRTLLNSSFSHAAGCEVIQYVATNTVYLVSDDGRSWIGPARLGAPGTLQNSQCILDTGASSASGSRDKLKLTLALTFLRRFIGLKHIYMLGIDRDGRVSGWQERGTWDADGVITQPPSAVSVNPNTGSGPSQTFRFSYSDPNGFGFIYVTRNLINNGVSHTGGCEIVHYATTNAVYLLSDDGRTWVGPGQLGRTGTLQNSQCILDTGQSSAVAVLDNLTVNLALRFKSQFEGNKSVYGLGIDKARANSGWQYLGTWRVFVPIMP